MPTSDTTQSPKASVNMKDSQSALTSEPGCRTIAGLPFTATVDELKAMNDSLDAGLTRLNDRLDEVRAKLAICQRAYDHERHLEDVVRKVSALDAELARKDAEEGRYCGGLIRQLKCKALGMRLMDDMEVYLKTRERGEAKWIAKAELKMARQDNADGEYNLRTLCKYVDNRKRKAKNQILANWYMDREAGVESGKSAPETSIHYLASSTFPKEKGESAPETSVHYLVPSTVPRTRRQESRVTEF